MAGWLNIIFLEKLTYHPARLIVHKNIYATNIKAIVMPHQTGANEISTTKLEIAALRSQLKKVTAESLKLSIKYVLHNIKIEQNDSSRFLLNTIIYILNNQEEVALKLKQNWHLIVNILLDEFNYPSEEIGLTSSDIIHATKIIARTLSYSRITISRSHFDKRKQNTIFHLLCHTYSQKATDTSCDTALSRYLKRYQQHVTQAKNSFAKDRFIESIRLNRVTIPYKKSIPNINKILIRISQLVANHELKKITDNTKAKNFLNESLNNLARQLNRLWNQPNAINNEKTTSKAKKRSRELSITTSGIDVITDNMKKLCANTPVPSSTSMKI